MHTIIICTAPNFADAGRQPLTTIHDFPNHSSEVVNIIADAEDTPVAALPVPLSDLERVNTVNKLEGLAMLQHRQALLAMRESGSLASGDVSAQACSLKRVRTINKLEGLGMLARRKPSSLKRVRTINKSAGLAILERRKALSAKKDSGNGSLVLAVLGRIRAICKRAGLDILGQCKSRKALLGGSVPPRP